MKRAKQEVLTLVTLDILSEDSSLSKSFFRGSGYPSSNQRD